MSCTRAHPRDISAADLEFALAAAEHPDLLRHLVALSRQCFGFYPGDLHYTLNYPWAAARLEHLPAGSQALDIGAGLNPLPLFLAERGVGVHCVDGAPVTRTPPPADDWNEWGFFDYGALHRNLRAHNCPVAEFAAPCRFDAIYSICVLAHMPRAIREDTLRRCRRWLNPGGMLLLAIDLVPSTDFVWNRGGEEEESFVQHGTVHDVTSCLIELEFELADLRIVRDIPRHPRTDLLFVHCQAPVRQIPSR